MDGSQELRTWVSSSKGHDHHEEDNEGDLKIKTVKLSRILQFVHQFSLMNSATC